MDENQNPMDEFLAVVENAKLQFDAVMLLSKMIEVMSAFSDPNDVSEEAMEKIIEAIISYGDSRVMQAMSK